MLKLPQSLERLIHELSKLPSIGPKSAQRLALYLLKKDDLCIVELSNAVANLKKDVTFCISCHNMTESSPCNICTDEKRDKTLVCVIEEPLDAHAIEKTGKFQGIYHVLGGRLNPLEGISPDKLNIDDLISKVTYEGVNELILATNLTLEGEATALYITNQLKDQPVKITRLARGLPMGGNLEYTDEITLARAFEGRN